jgi:heptosyltransferase-2
MINRVLVLRFRRVGDSVLSVALCSSLRATFPGATIHYVMNDNIAPLFEHHPAVDRLVTFTREETASLPAYLRKVRRVVREGRYDLIIDTRSTIRTLWFSLFSLSTPWRIGRAKWYGAFLLNHRVPLHVEGLDEIQRTLRLLSPLERIVDVHYDPVFRLYLTPDERAAARRDMISHGIDFSRPVIVCVVATRIPVRAWDMDRMQLLLLRVIRDHDAQLIFNYAGAAEESVARRLHHAMNDHPNVFIDISAPTLRGLAALISNASFFFGNEGGPRHISPALDVPSFAIYPPHISKTKWLPNAGPRFQGIHPSELPSPHSWKSLDYTSRYALVTVDAVWSRLSPMLHRYLPSPPSPPAAEQ